MTRLLVIGNSHAAALKLAEAEFRSAYPGIETGFFAAPGAVFLRGRVDGSGRFSTQARDAATLATLARINGGQDCDLNDWDQVLVIGHRLRFPGVAALLERHDLLEGSRTGKGQMISWALVTATVAAAIDDYLRLIVGRFGAARNVTFFAGPFVAESIVERAPGYPLARTVAAYLDHPDMPGIFDWWLSEWEAAVTKAGFGFLRQPDSTLGGPGLTASRFAIPTASDQAPAAARIDHRHMNRDFGFAVLSAFAQTRLGLSPQHPSNSVIQETHQ